MTGESMRQICNLGGIHWGRDFRDVRVRSVPSAMSRLVCLQPPSGARQRPSASPFYSKTQQCTVNSPPFLHLQLTSNPPPLCRWCESTKWLSHVLLSVCSIHTIHDAALSQHHQGTLFNLEYLKAGFSITAHLIPAEMSTLNKCMWIKNVFPIAHQCWYFLFAHRTIPKQQHSVMKAASQIELVGWPPYWTSIEKKTHLFI